MGILRDRFERSFGSPYFREHVSDLAPPNRWASNSPHIHGAHAAVEEPSIAEQHAALTSDGVATRDARSVFVAKEMIKYI